MKICVYGAASDDIARVFIDEGERLGALIAERGHELVYGGGATGMMGAVSRGVKSAGGRVTGIAPEYFNEPGVLFEGCDEMIYTDTMRERKQLMEDRSNAFIMTPGGIGTYEEFFETLTLAAIGRHKKPIAILNVAGYFNWVDELIDSTVKQGFAAKDIYGCFNTFADPVELLDYLERGQAPSGAE